MKDRVVPAPRRVAQASLHPVENEVQGDVDDDRDQQYQRGQHDPARNMEPLAEFGLEAGEKIRGAIRNIHAPAFHVRKSKRFDAATEIELSVSMSIRRVDSIKA